MIDFKNHMGKNKRSDKIQQEVLADSPFWKPTNKGETIKGKFASLQKTMYKQKMGVAILLTGVNKIVPVTASIKSLLGRYIPKLTTKDHLQFTFNGSKKTASKNTVKVIDVFLNGKQLQGTFEPPTKSELTEFLSRKD